MVGAQFCRARLTGDEADKPGGIGEGVVAEVDRRPLWSCIQLVDVRGPAQPLDGDHIEQVVDFAGKRSEAIDHLRCDLLDPGFVRHMRETAIQVQPGRKVVDIVFGNQNRRAEIDRR